MKFYSDEVTEDVLTRKDSLSERHLEVCLVDNFVPSREACVYSSSLAQILISGKSFCFF